MRVLAVLGCAVAVSLAANASRAAEAPAAPTYTPPPAPTYAPGPYYYYAPPGYYYAAPPPKPKSRWYGWQTLATDGAATMMLFAAADSRDGAGLAYGSLAMYNLGAPIVHFAHGNFGRGLGSLAVRSLPSVLIFGEPHRVDDRFLLFTVLSVPAMIAVDAAALARDDEEPAPQPSTPYGVQIAPTASATKNGGVVGLAGVF